LETLTTLSDPREKEGGREKQTKGTVVIQWSFSSASEWGRSETATYGDSEATGRRRNKDEEKGTRN
jgi:hypothetical protein